MIILQVKRKKKIQIVWLIFFIFCFNSILGCQKVYDWLGGNFKGEPQNLKTDLSQSAQNLINKSFAGIEEGQIVDHHVHVLAKDQSIGKFCPNHDLAKYKAYVNPKNLSWLNPKSKIKTEIFMSASQITDLDQSSEQYAARLLELVKYFGTKAKFYLLALDGYYETSGMLNLDKTYIMIPSAYIVLLAKCLNQKIKGNPFIPVISIHPYRIDALDKLRYFAKQGVRFIKWLPPAMNINPARVENKAYYQTMLDLDMILLGHTGHEASLDSENNQQRLGNPLYYTLPLDMGVTIVMAHLGNWGENENAEGKMQQNYELVFEMLEKAHQNKKWKLYGGLSSVSLKQNIGNLKALFKNKHLWHLMINGSDYPLPAISFLNNTSLLQELDYITEDEKEALDEIYGFNPLLFNFVLKRTLRNPNNHQEKLPISMFTSLKNLSKY